MGSGNILISSAGRRVGLIQCVRDSIARHGVERKVVTIDAGCSAPASFVTEAASRVPRCTDPEYLNIVLGLCAKHEIGFVIPTIDTELGVYSGASKQFGSLGMTVCISEVAAVQICCDKIKTHEWLVANGFPTVRQTDVRFAMLHPAEWPFPFIAKPFNGSASVGVRRIENQFELAALAQAPGEFIVQELAKGREFTINVYVNRTGECICAVPHWRMEVRAGEVSKGITVKDQKLMDVARRVAEALPGAYGALNVQCFMDDTGVIRIIEINARFGGGYPLAHRAGARFTDWLLDEADGKSLSYREDWTDDLAMLRYDGAVFVAGSRIRG